MSWQSVLGFMSRHKDGLIPLGMAVAVTMRPKLPWPLNRFEPLEWLYEWARDALLTFVSLRGPAHAESGIQRDVERKKETDPTGKVVESTKESITGSTAETPQEKPST